MKRKACDLNINLKIDGIFYEAIEGELLAVVLLRLGLQPFRKHLIDGSSRSPYCMMGVCFDCLVTVDGQTNQQACLTVVADGMSIERNCQ